MQKRSYQTKVWSKVNSTSLVGKVKLALASVLLLIVIALAVLAMPLLASTPRTLAVPSQTHSLMTHAFSSGGCNPQPTC